MEIQQTHQYETYIKKIGWNTERFQTIAVYWRNIPLVGTIAKIQRPMKLPDPMLLAEFLRYRQVRRLSFEPDAGTSQSSFDTFITVLRNSGIKINSSSNLATKTIRISLTEPADRIFDRFSEAKRRAVRRAIKNNVQVAESSSIAELIRIKNKSAGFLGFITTTGIDKLWPLFAPDHAAILLASHNRSPVGGILLLFYDSVAYYWIAGATKKGKKLFAPTLLVWEALKLSKKKKMKWFDFVGVWDERFPKQNSAWLGFTKFKEGFGGTSLYYPIVKS